MNSRNNLEDLLQVLEGIRNEIADDIPPEVIKEIVQKEYVNQDSSLAASIETKKVLKTYLDSLN